jgi:protein-L-isoaspartate(D-aspartate) O-methyltransferase
MIRTPLLLLLAYLATAAPAPAQEPDYARARAAMIETVRASADTDVAVLGPGGISERVLAAMARTERHRFVPERFRSFAYDNRPVPIGHDQTISQPYVVALMTHLAAVEPEHTVLEIGTGSGYQAAILAQLARTVCTMEIVRPLAETAQAVLKDLGYQNVRVRIGDGYRGWPECGPFDVIVVTAALGHVPPPLIEQLKVGGRLVMPVGGAIQHLTVVEKIAPAQTRTRTLVPVRFVPFTRSGD